jgi:hypothetical protein
LIARVTGIINFLPASFSFSKRSRIAFVLALVLFFLWVNRSAYRGFFTDDDLDNLANARGSSLSEFGKALLRPDVGPEGNFRAAAYFYYFVLARTAGTRYIPYVAGIQAIHLLNVALVFLLARALGSQMVGACAAALLFVFHAAALDVYWKAMYVFDLVCATFTLSCLLAYVRGRIVLSVVCFWLALKSKEVPILLPLILAAYELWFGGRNWKRLLPFFAISAVMGASALFFNAHRDSAYTLRFTGPALWECARYYAGQLAFIPYAGFAILAALLLRPKQVRWGVLAFLLLLAPMLVLPGRLFAAYLYVPLIGLSVAISSITAPLALALFFLLWIPWNYRQVRPYRNQNIAAASERRDWFRSLTQFVPQHPEIQNFVYDGAPQSLESYGVVGGVRLLRAPQTTTRVEPLDSPEGKQFLRGAVFGVLVWDATLRRVTGLANAPDVAYIKLDPSAPVWQLEEGWLGNQGTFRWMRPVAKARLYRQAGASAFEVVVNVSEYYIAHLHESRFEAVLNGVSLGAETLKTPKPITLRFSVPAGAPGTVVIEFRVSPPLPDPNNGPPLGQPIAAFGFR